MMMMMMMNQEVWGTEIPSGKGSRDEVPQKLKLFAHNVLKNGYRKCVFRYIHCVPKKRDLVFDDKLN